MLRTPLIGGQLQRLHTGGSCNAYDVPLWSTIAEEPRCIVGCLNADGRPFWAAVVRCFGFSSFREDLVFIRFGGDLLSHALRRSTIGASVLNFRVRDGIGCFTRAMTTKPNKYQGAILFALISTVVHVSTHWCMLLICQYVSLPLCYLSGKSYFYWIKSSLSDH